MLLDPSVGKNKVFVIDSNLQLYELKRIYRTCVLK